MSLRWFHAIFIGICVLLAIFVAAWAVRHAHWMLALVAPVGGTWLVVYRETFLRRRYQSTITADEHARSVRDDRQFHLADVRPTTVGGLPPGGPVDQLFLFRSKV